MGRKLRIAVTGGTKGSRAAWYFSRFLLASHGAAPFFLHPASQSSETDFDALLITGGRDIDPQSYGGEAHPAIVRTDAERDAMELALIGKAHENGAPLMGICRGMQLINLYFGGTLHPHIHDFELENIHSHTPLPRKEIMIDDDSRLYALLGQHRLLVNALHHQAVDRPGMKMRAVAHDRNKIVQAIEHTELPFVFGLQWHPEFMPYAWHSRKLFSAFVHAAKAHVKGAKPL